MPLPTDATPNPAIDAIDAEAAQQQADADARQKKQEDEKLVGSWVLKIASTKRHDEAARKRYEVDRKAARGDTDWLVDTNLIGAIIEILAAFIYAKNPDVSVAVSRAVGAERAHKYGQVAKTIEVVVSRLMFKAGLKRQAKRWLRSSMTVGVGWLTAGILTRSEVDPIIEGELNDLKTKIRQYEQLQQANAAGDVTNYDEACAELRIKEVALRARLERAVATGAFVDFRAADDVIVSAECGELENYLAAPWIALETYKAKAEAKALSDWPDDEEHRLLFKNAATYMQRQRGSGDQVASDVPNWVPVPAGAEAKESDDDGFVRVTEIWHKRDGVVLTLLDGCKKWLRAPYAPVTGERFYNVFMLGCHFIDGERHPQSDVHQLRKLQEEYSRTRSNFAEHRRRAIAATLFDKTQIDENSMTAITKSSTQEFIGIETTNQQPLQNAFFPKPYAAVDQSLYDTSAIRMDMEKVSGAQDAQQGGIAVEKTLGEAEIQQSGFQARTGARRDYMEDVLTDAYEYMAQVALQLLGPQEAVKYAGPEAIWTQLNVEEATTFFDIEVKAGSTGKPRNSMDKQTWGTLLPLLQDMINRVGAARQQGQEWAAKPWIALLRETAQRLDDRIDVDAMLPVVPQELVTPPPAPGAPPPLTELDKAKIKKEGDQAYLARAQGVAALAALGLPPQLGEDPQSGAAGMPPELAAMLGPLLQKLGAGGGPAPGGPAPTPVAPDPSTAALTP